MNIASHLETAHSLAVMVPSSDVVSSSEFSKNCCRGGNKFYKHFPGNLGAQGLPNMTVNILRIGAAEK